MSMRHRHLLILAIAGAALLQAGSAEANSPVLSATPSSVTFGSQAVGSSSATTTVTVTNTDGTNSYTLGSVNVGSPSVFPITQDNCSGQTLGQAGGGSDACTFHVGFAPAAAQNYSDTVTVPVTSASGDDLTLAVSGTGTAPAVSLPSSKNFSTSPGVSTQNTVTLQNTGNGTLNVGTLSVSGGASGEFTIAPAGASNTCSGQSVAPTATCTVQISYLPTAPESVSTTLNVPSNAASSVDHVTLNGVSNASVASVTPATLPLGNVPVGQTSSSQQVTVKNTGVGTSLAVTSVSSTDAAFTVGADGCSGQSLSPGASCTVSVTFSSTAAGSHSATLNVVDNAGYGSASPQQVTMTATATVPGVAFSPSPVPAFPSTVAGRTSATQTVTVTNSGAAPLTISSVAVGGANFKNFQITAQTCTAGSPIAPSGTCTITAAFRPTSTGARNGALVLSGNLPTPNHGYVIAVSGTGLPPANLRSVHVAAGCDSSRVSWLLPPRGTAGYVRAWIVRNHGHLPTSPTDGAVYFDTSPGTLANGPLQHFTRYYYRVYAEYSFAHGVAAFSAGTPLSMHTGWVCSPRNGGQTPSTRPTIAYLGYRYAVGYAIVVYHGSHKLYVGFGRSTAIRINRRLSAHAAYSIRLYAYTRTRPKGFLLGTSSFTVT